MLKKVIREGVGWTLAALAVGSIIAYLCGAEPLSFKFITAAFCLLLLALFLDIEIGV